MKTVVDFHLVRFAVQVTNAHSVVFKNLDEVLVIGIPLQINHECFFDMRLVWPLFLHDPGG